MKVSIKEDAGCRETEVHIRCSCMDESVSRLVAAIRMLDGRLVGERGGETWLLDPRDVLYMDTVDKRAFIYVKGEVYETPMRLYELEERLAGLGFFRAGKSLIVNIDQIQSIRPDLGGRLDVRMKNGERRIVSRQYAGELRKKLGL